MSDIHLCVMECRMIKPTEYNETYICKFSGSDHHAHLLTEDHRVCHSWYENPGIRKHKGVDKYNYSSG